MVIPKFKIKTLPQLTNKSCRQTAKPKLQKDTGKEAGVYNQTKNQIKPLKNLDVALKEDSYQKLDKEVIKQW